MLFRPSTFVLFMAILVCGSCAENTPPDVPVVPSQAVSTPPVELPPEPPPEREPDLPSTGQAELPKSDAERLLDAHFERYEPAPVKTINSQDFTDAPDSPRQSIKIGSHQVEWLTDRDDRGIRTPDLRINGERIPIDGEMTLNQIDEDDRQDAGWANDWWKVRFYKLNDRELIGIEMIQRSCTGLSCSVGIQLLYDLKTKKRNYFGTFRTDSEIRLFRFAGEKEYFYVSRSCDCLNASGEYVVTYNLYKMRPDGEFVIQNAPIGKPYFIRHSFYPAEREPYTGRIIPPKEPDKLEQNWIRLIK